MVARRIRIGASIVTIFDEASLPNDISDLGAAYTFRNVIPVTGANLGRVRVTFKNQSTGNFTVNNASVGVYDVGNPLGDNENTISIPNELLFSASSGFTITAGNTLVSDWVATTDTFTASDKLVVIFDMSAAGAFVANSTGSAGVRYARFVTGATSYNLKHVEGTGNANATYCIIKIETGP